MLCANSVEVTKFPVSVTLRDGQTTVTVHKDRGIVTAAVRGHHTSVVAHHSTASRSYRTFLEFWGVVFADEAKTSLAFNQLIPDLLAGRIQQDIDCPYLFLDMTNDHGDIEGARPLLKANKYGGTIEAFNPDDFYANQGFALEEDPRVKFYCVIEDCEGNDFPVGYAAGVTQVAGQEPEFNMDSATFSRDKDGIIKVATGKATVHSMENTPSRNVCSAQVPEPVDDFSDNIPF